MPQLTKQTSNHKKDEDQEIMACLSVGFVYSGTYGDAGELYSKYIFVLELAFT